MRAGQLKPEAAKVVPWSIERFRGLASSVCKGRWIQIRHGIRTCYAQWEDVGPFNTDLASYVFGDERPLPNPNHGAGIDVSPAVRDCLGLISLDLVDWRFVEQADVVLGPWLQNCGAQAVSSISNYQAIRSIQERNLRTIDRPTFRKNRN